jgi:hypothetical protein
MTEPTVKIKADRVQRIYVVEGETLIVTPERAKALEGFCTVLDKPAPRPKDRMLRSPQADN